MAGRSELFEAIGAGDLPRLRELITADPGLAAARDESGVSAVLFALYRRKTQALEILLAAGQPLDLFEAASLGRPDRVREILAGDPGAARAWTADGFTALHLAAFLGTPEVAALLLEAGAEVSAEARNVMKVTPLHSAAAAHSVATCGLLLDRGATVDARQQQGWTALHEAAQSGNLPLLRLLLARGADPSLANDTGTTALQLAEAKGQREAAEVLRVALGQ